MTDDASSHGVGGSSGALPPVIRAACLLLIVTGLASVGFSFPVARDPAAARCHLARTWIEAANQDNKDWNDVDLAGREPEAVPCEEAVLAAEGIRIDEKDAAETAAMPGEAALRIQNLAAMVIGVGQGAAAFMLLRTRSRAARKMALGFGGAGIVLQVLGFISLGAFVFTVYALVFHPASREVWPRIRR